MRAKNPPVYFTFFLLAYSFLAGCETDVDITAPYKSTPVIYGILDYTADTQFVRINRTFLGEGNVSDYAGIKDSVEYPLDEVDAKLIKYKDNVAIDSFPLEAIDLPSRNPGVFYRENVRFYHTAETLLSESEISDINKMHYALRVRIKDKEYTATTNFPRMRVGTIDFPPALNPPFRLELISGSGIKRNIDFIIQTDPTAYEYEAVFRLNFDLYTTSGEFLPDQYIDYSIGDIRNAEGTSTERRLTLSTADWFNVLGDRLDLIPGAKNIRIENVELRLTGGTQDLVLFQQVSRPVSDFTPVMNTFSNLSGDAIGLFSAKAQMGRAARLGEPVMLALNNSDETGAYCFCVLDWAGSEYVCHENPANCN